jgi:hypothetical protein
MRRGPVKTHLTGYRQLLTRGPKGCHPPTAAKGPESVPTVHSQISARQNLFPDSCSRLPIYLQNAQMQGRCLRRTRWRW